MLELTPSFPKREYISLPSMDLIMEEPILEGRVKEEVVIQDKKNIAVVAIDSLGDSLLYFMLSYNLSNNSYDVTLFSNLLSSMSAWCPSITIKPYPESENTESILDSFDLVIMDTPFFLFEKLGREKVIEFSKKYVLINQNLPAEYQHDLGLAHQHPALRKLAGASGSIRDNTQQDRHMVEHFEHFMKERLSLDKIQINIPLNIPENFSHKKYDERVLLFPFTPNPDKNWSLKSFLKLQKKLVREGLNAKIVVAPNEIKLLAASVDFISFTNIEELALYVYESALVITNDSGGGHLASFLNVPTITLYKKKRRSFVWRPGWFPGSVIRPVFDFKFFGQRIWRPFIRVDRVKSEALKTLSRATR